MRIWQTSILTLAIGFLLWSCNLMQNPKNTETASFTTLYDSIKTFDSVTIVFKTKDGRTIDTVYQGRFVSKEDFQKLPVNGWDGGKAVILITAYKADEIVYKVEKHFDGTTDTTENTFVIIETSRTITPVSRELLLVEGDSLDLLSLLITKPTTLTNADLIWSSNPVDILLFGETY